MKLSSEQLATILAVKDECDKILKDNGDDLPVGEYDVSGRTVTITLTQGTKVEKVAGTNGNGTNSKQAVQNLYGWAVITQMAERLRLFNQWNAIRQAMIEVLRDALKGNGNVTDEMAINDPEFSAQVAKIRSECKLPDRVEKAPRYVRRDNPRQRARLKIEDANN